MLTGKTQASEAIPSLVPRSGTLHDLLAAHKVESEGHADVLVFGRSRTRPFSSEAVIARARRTWKRAGLEGVGFHEARHCYASFMIASGMTNVRALASYMGHSSVALVWDRYGHLLPGTEREAARQLDAFLRSARTVAQLEARA